MSENFKAAITAMITIATITVFVLPRKEQPVSSTIRVSGKYLTGAIRSMLGVDKPTKRQRPLPGPLFPNR